MKGWCPRKARTLSTERCHWQHLPPTSWAPHSGLRAHSSICFAAANALATGVAQAPQSAQPTTRNAGRSLTPRPAASRAAARTTSKGSITPGGPSRAWNAPTGVVRNAMRSELRARWRRRQIGHHSQIPAADPPSPRADIPNATEGRTCTHPNPPDSAPALRRRRCGCRPWLELWWGTRLEAARIWWRRRPVPHKVGCASPDKAHPWSFWPRRRAVFSDAHQRGVHRVMGPGSSSSHRWNSGLPIGRHRPRSAKLARDSPKSPLSWQSSSEIGGVVASLFTVARCRPRLPRDRRKTGQHRETFREGHPTRPKCLRQLDPPQKLSTLPRGARMRIRPHAMFCCRGSDHAERFHSDIGPNPR